MLLWKKGSRFLRESSYAIALAIKYKRCHCPAPETVSQWEYIHICHSERSEESNKSRLLNVEILRLKTQNDIATQSRRSGNPVIARC
jgi:hypothetical protein